MMTARPKLNKEISIQDFKEFYWLKKELVQFCKNVGLKANGGKIEISQRIEEYLETGQKGSRLSNKNIKPKSKFDWKNKQLSNETEITDNYKNTENVRDFFKQEIGSKFRFNVEFMTWMKTNTGKTLKDAVMEWKRINAESRNRTKPKEIAPQFEYNKYLRDFLSDNPKETRNTAIQLWKIKKSLRGNNKYNKDDLKLIEKNKTR